MNGTLIGKYNGFVQQAQDAERQKNWTYAAKMWGEALRVSGMLPRRHGRNYCTNRQAFCQGMDRRATNAG